MCGLSKEPASQNAPTVRPLDPIDALRCAFLGEPESSNRAFTVDGLCKDKPSRALFIQASKASLSLRKKSRAWVSRRGNRVVGLVVARPRSGPESWEIADLFLSSRSDAHLPELLEKPSRSAVSSGGQRMFLRLRRDDPLVDDARRGGFFPCVPELLYKGLPAPAESSASQSSSSWPVPLREREPSDVFEIFRLYNATTPSEVRHVTGMTFDHWTASREYGPSREFVLDNNGAVGGWLMIAARSGAGQLATMVHPSNEHVLRYLVEFGLKRLSGTKAVYCLVPEYQTALQRALTDRGFQVVSDYITLVKSMALRAREDARAGATVAST